MRELFGWECQRSEQFCGKAGDSDVQVKHLPNLLVECKREENLSIHAAMAKAVEDAGEKLPVVFHRRTKTPWLVTIRMEDLEKLSLMIASLKNGQAEKDTTSSQP